MYLPLIAVTSLIAIGEFRSTARFADLIYLNSTLTEEDSADAAVIDRYAAEAEGIITANECRSDILQAGLSLVMRDLDLQDSTNGYDAWAAAMDRANRYVLHGLSCNPANGDMWVRLALVSQSVGENPQQLATLMSQSVLLYPAELRTIQARFVVWKRATDATLAASADTLGRDIRTFLNYASVRDIADILSTPGNDPRSYTLGLANSNLNPYIAAAVTLLPEERRAFLTAKGIVLPGTPAK